MRDTNRLQLTGITANAEGNLARILIVFLGLIVASANAGAQVLQPPPGWTSNPDNNGVMMHSPADAAGRRVAYAVRAVEPVAGSVDIWFAKLIARAIGAATVVQRSGLQREQTILKETVIVRGADGTDVRIDALAYPTPQGQQVMMIAFPAELGAGDARVDQAYDHFAALWRSGYRLAAGGKPSPPGRAAPPPTARPGTPPTGKNCRREPVWGQRISPFCTPSGICPDRVIKEYRTVCD